MKCVTRREFLKTTGAVAAGVGLFGVLGARPTQGRAKPTYSGLLPQVTLGGTGVQVSRLGLGGKGLLEEGTQADDDAAIQAIHEAIDGGISYLDTSSVYHRSEDRIGVVMQTRRNEVFLATKTGARTYDQIMPEVEQSLAKLHTSCVDLLQLHFVYFADDVYAFGQPYGAYWTLYKLKDEGICTFIGMTGHPDFAQVGQAADPV